METSGISCHALAEVKRDVNGGWLCGGAVQVADERLGDGRVKVNMVREKKREGKLGKDEQAIYEG